MCRALEAKGYGVQLAHEPDEQQRHFVSLLVDGVELARHDTLQSNGMYRENAAVSQQLVDEFDAKASPPVVEKAAKAAVKNA